MKKLALVIYLLPILICSQTYILDEAFGNNGIVVTDFNNSENVPRSFIELDNHKILLLTKNSNFGNPNVGLVKYLPSGELDLNFGINGFFELVLEEQTFLRKILLQNNNKVILFGRTGTYPNYSFYMSRHLQNGNLDLTFGNNGVVINSEINSNNVIIQDDGKIIVCGNTTINNINYLKIMRFLVDGTIDTSFGNNGITITLINENYNGINNIKIFNNNIFVALRTSSTNEYNSYVVNYQPNGVLNTNFGTNGVLNFLTTNLLYYKSVFTVNNNGELIFAIPNENTYYLTQYTINGDLDLSFGINGIATNDFDNSNNMYGFFLDKFILKDNNKLILSISLVGYENSCLFLTGFNENGVVDSSFSINENNSYQHRDILLRNDEKLLILGETYWYDQNQNIVLEQFTKNTLSIIENSQEFNIYPNPITNDLTIKQKFNNNSSYKIVDLLGKQIKTGKLSGINNATTTIDLSALNKGVYFVKINNKTYKIVKK